MMQLVSKTTESLNESERIQLETIIRRYYKGAKDGFIDQRIRKGTDFEIVLQKEGEEVLAASFYHLQEGSSPFFKKSFIAQFGIAVKKEGHRGNVIWKNSTWYAKNRVGAFYLLNNAIGISMICNPKVFENFVKLFPYNYPFQTTENKDRIIDFLHTYFRGRNIPVQLDGHLCFQDENICATDITEEYAGYYRSKNERINTLFFELGILSKKEDKIYLTGKHITVCGCRNLFGFRRKIK